MIHTQSHRSHVPVGPFPRLLVMLALLAALAALLLALRALPIGSGSAASLPSLPGNTLQAVHGSAGIVAGPHGSASIVLLTHVTTVAGMPVPLSAIRSGDTITTQGATLIDRSQTYQELSGIVASIPLNPGDPFAVQLPSGRTILVDVDTHTAFHAPSGTGLSLDTLSETDRVTISGLVDTRLGEMTRVSRLTTR